MQATPATGSLRGSPSRKELLPVLLPAGPIGPSRSFAGIWIHYQSMPRMPRIEVERIDQRTSQRVERTITMPKVDEAQADSAFLMAMALLSVGVAKRCRSDNARSAQGTAGLHA